MTKRKRSKKTRFSFDLNAFLNRFYWVLAIVSVIAAALVVGYYAGYNDARDENRKAIYKEREVSAKLMERIKKMTLKTSTHEYSDQPESLVHPPKGPKREPKLLVKKPKLAIIIDDVSFAHDVRNIKALGLNLTMAFLPPNRIHPDSAKLAAKESYYMVHLPMEAQNFGRPEPITLLVDDPEEKIMERIEQIKELFPKVRYINNHTGSKFTSDEKAMNRLVYALKRKKIGFIDSRTTSKTKVPQVMKNFGLPYIGRDVFLDHDPDVNSVKRQIKRAVKIAKSHGLSVAIGHPHKKTLQALKESKKLLQSVELVRIDELY
jgi:polysaccharide deacetylase 2 family uncharacterized protein YibQ